MRIHAAHYCRLASISLICVSTLHREAIATPAFPGAEGVAASATGGRGGDVHHVTNLNDSGVGSLRYGIQNAPANGRTIVFDVAGTIHLATPLAFNGKSNLTIAGQTAPGGGITLADDMTQVNNSQNVILQFLRFRPGSTHGSSSTDALWVQNSSNIMIDHVTASWGVDETLSATHLSNNVTVQWSMISQALYNAGHSETDHSFGTLLNGGDFTFHHNLYAHNKRRNPNFQNDNHYPRLDWVNNVTYNPRDAYMESKGAYDLNVVGNYAIKGPRFSNSNNALVRPDGAGSKIYFAGNVMDLDRNGLADGQPIGTENFESGASWTQLTERATLPLVNTTDAKSAYIQVLSRAGASRYRDSVDRRVVRTIFNQLDAHLQTEADWGGWPMLPGGTASADSNGDGVPDGWAAAAGFDPASAAPGQLLNAVYAPDGYTYLEKYIHSLTPHAFSPANTASRTISTGFGRGADAQVSENGGTSATSSGNGTAGVIDVYWDGAGGMSNQAMLLKFDLSQIEPGSVTSARLELTAAATITGPHSFKVYGLEHDAPGWDWAEANVQFNGAPGLVFDGNSRTLGIDPRYTANGSAASPTNPPLPISDNLLTLGTITIGGATAGQNIALDNINLAVFVNLSSYFQAGPQADVVTIILEQTASASPASFYSKEGSQQLAPRLVVDALARQASGHAGDFNNDGSVDVADYIVWRKGLGTLYTNDDYNTWRVNFGWSANAGAASGAAPMHATAAGSDSSALPEPSSIVVVPVGLTTLSYRVRSRTGRPSRTSQFVPYHGWR